MTDKQPGPAKLALTHRARELRERLGLTQQLVGERLGMTGVRAAQRVYKFESGYQLGPPEFLPELAEQGLEVHPANLLMPPGSPMIEDLAVALLELRALAGGEADKVLHERGIKVGWLRELTKGK